MKLYIINGEGYTWDYIHNSLGYTEYPSDTMLYMSAESATWGEYVTSGYSQYEGVYGDLGSCTFFATGKTGWFDLDDLAKDAGLFPSVVYEGPEFTNGSVTSPSMMYDFNGDLFYLLRDAVVLGWKSESDLAAQGWTIEVDVNYELLFFDVSTGKISYGVETLNEMVFTETGYFTIEDGSDVVFVQPSQYPVVSPLSHNFDPNVSVADGVTLATDLPYYPTKLYIPVVVWHDESWNFYTDYIGWDIDGTSGSIVVTNNTGGTRIVLSVIAVLIDATDAEVVEVKNQLDEHFRAFKWTSGGTDYYYVEDGNEAWTDDLAAEGYEEVPAVVLPVVTTSDRLWVTAQSNHTDFNANATSIARVWDFDINAWVNAEYDSSLSYASGFWSAENSGTGRYGITLSRFGYTEYLGIRNSLSYTIPRFIEANYATCSSNLAVAVPVFRHSDLIPYTAFKFSADGIDYYYVLDDEQSDWTSDLGAIGYTLTSHIDIVLGIKWNPDETELESVDMSNDWYWSRVITQADKARLDLFGLWYDSGYKHGSMLYWWKGMPYNLSLIDVYTDIGETPAPGALSAFSLYQSQNNVLALRCDQTYQTLVKTYKVRITARL